MSSQGASTFSLAPDQDESQSLITEIKTEKNDSSPMPVCSVNLGESSNISPSPFLYVRSQNLSGTNKQLASAITKSWDLGSTAVQFVPISHNNTTVTEVSTSPSYVVSANKKPRYMKMLYSFPVSVASGSVADGQVHMTVPGRSEPVPLTPVVCWPSSEAGCAKNMKTGHRKRRQKDARSKTCTLTNQRCPKVNTPLEYSQEEICRCENENSSNSFVTSVADRTDFELSTRTKGVDDNPNAAGNRLHDITWNPVDVVKRCPTGSKETLEYSEENQQETVKLEPYYCISLNENLQQGCSNSDTESADECKESDTYSPKIFKSTNSSNDLEPSNLYEKSLTNLRSRNLCSSEIRTVKSDVCNSETDTADECEKERQTETCDTVIFDRIKTEMVLHNQIDFPTETDYMYENESVVCTVPSVADRISMEISKAASESGYVSVDVILRYIDFVSRRALSVTHRVEMELERLKIQDLRPQSTDTGIIGSEEDEEEDKNKQNEQKDCQKNKKLLPRAGVLTFTTEELYILLIEEKGAEYACKNCRMVFSDKHDARSHVDSHSPYRCVACNITFPSAGTMKTHSRIVHEEIHHCNFCLYSTKHNSDFEKHVKVEHKQSKIEATVEMVCYVCGVFCHVWDPIDEHLEKEHGIEKTYMEGDFQCPLCNRILRSKQSFRVHIRKHEGEYRKCPHPDCKYQSLNPYIIRHHYKAMHVANRKYCCPFEGCETRFKANGQLKEHLNVVHYKIRKFICETCKKGFLTRKHLSVHERIHSDIKPVGCKFCEYRCRQTASLKWHMKQTHPEHLDTVATTGGQYPKHCLKRGRKTTRKKKVKSGRQRNVAGKDEVKAVSARTSSSLSDSDCNGSYCCDIPQECPK